MDGPGRRIRPRGRRGTRPPPSVVPGRSSFSRTRIRSLNRQSRLRPSSGARWARARSPALAAASGPIRVAAPLTAIDQSCCPRSSPSSPEVSMSRETARRRGRESPARTRGSMYSTKPLAAFRPPVEHHRTGDEAFHQEPVGGPYVGLVDSRLRTLSKRLERSPGTKVEASTGLPPRVSRATSRRRTPGGETPERGMKQTASRSRSTTRTGPSGPRAHSTISRPRGVSRASRVRRKTSAVESTGFPVPRSRGGRPPPPAPEAKL